MWLKRALISALVILLSACGGNTYAPVSERASPQGAYPDSSQSTAVPGAYIVRKGDTLYSIAFRYGLDYRELARQNNIDQHFKIFPGQKLKLNAASSPATQGGSIVRDSSIKAPKPDIVASARRGNQTGIISTSKASTQNKDPLSSGAKNAASKPQSKVKTQAKAQAVPGKRKSTKPQKPKPEVKTIGPAPPASTRVKKATGPIKWRWPVSGRVVSTFKTRGKVNKGINISGVKGTAIKAAAKGRVVYAGNGLLGYGNLVIVDHNQQFLSAYAHNSRVLVKENDMVKGGQKIAEMGSSGANRVMLHFEIRRDGKPVNPLRYLPRK
ncbi:MAG: peptidase M23 [Neptuniibacter caesariensis]|uniref:Peptidase M23 n=1 Tax=Neptuniibacter caesariensis TaxID=207954 RepID=A0A2G6JNG7_NEPCE|nr:MAG: peptidase M23 [Neptuniibacter caesariensis]